MLRTDRGHDADLRFDKIHQLRNVADMVRSHFADKHLMRRLQLLPDRNRANILISSAILDSQQKNTASYPSQSLLPIHTMSIL